MLFMSKQEQLIEIFKATGKAHHQAYLSVDGADDNWMTWYARYLMLETEFPNLVPGFDEPKLSQTLVDLDVEARGADQHWAEVYADSLLNHPPIDD